MDMDHSDLNINEEDAGIGLSDPQVEPPPKERRLGGTITEPKEARNNPLYEDDGTKVWREFGSIIGKEYRDIMTQCSDMREMEPRRFSERFELEKRRLRNEPEFYFDVLGRVVKGVKDAHAQMGVALGWSAQAIYSIGDFMNQAIFESSNRPLEAKGRGSRDENERLATVVNHINDELVRLSEFNRIGRDRSAYVGAHGTACLRYYPISKLSYHKNSESGEYAEARGDVEPFLELWPLENVLVTNYERSEAWDQEAVFWLTPNAHLHQMESNEATWEYDDETGVNKKITGRFFNLSNLRATSGKSTTHDNSSGFYSFRRGDSSRDYSVSGQPVFDLIEIEGLLPSKIIDWILKGVFTWQMALDAGIDVGMPEPVTEDEKREFAARLLRIRWWNISFIRPKNAAPGSEEWILIEFFPSPLYNPDSITKRVNSLFLFKYLWNELEFFGTSVTSIGYRLEDAADLLQNDALRITHFNANPSSVVNRRALRKETINQMVSFFTPDAIHELNADMMNIGQVLQVMKLEEPSDIPAKIAMYKMEFETITAVLATIKQGSGDEQTLGAIQINQARAQSRLHGILARMAVEDVRLFKAMIEDQVNLRGPENFNKWTAKIAGRAGMNMDGIYVSPDGIWEDVDLIPPSSFIRDRTLLTQTILQAWTLFGGPESLRGGPRYFNIHKVQKALFELSGWANADTILEPGYQPITPEEKYLQLSQGNWIDPPANMPVQDMMFHLSSDQQMLLACRDHKSGFNPEEEQILAQQLVRLLPLEQRLLENTIAMMGQQQGIGGAGAGQGGSGPPAAMQGGIRGGLAPQFQSIAPRSAPASNPSPSLPASPMREAQ